MGDVVSGRAPHLPEVRAAVLLSPLAIPLGAPGVELSRGRPLLLAGGLLFWPGFALLLWRVFMAPLWWHWAALLLWVTQGCFQILHRLDVLLSG